jgi:hypothetical protein
MFGFTNLTLFYYHKHFHKLFLSYLYKLIAYEFFFDKVKKILLFI